MEPRQAFVGSLIFTIGSLLFFGVTFVMTNTVFGLDNINSLKVLGIASRIFLILATIISLGATCFAGFGFYEKKNEYLLQARTIALIAITFLITSLFVSILELKSYLSWPFIYLQLSVGLLAASFIPLRVAIERHVKNEGGQILPFLESLKVLYHDIRSWFVYGRTGIINIMKISAIVVKVKQRGDELFRDVTIPALVIGSSLIDELKELIAVKFDRKADEVHQLLKNNDMVLERDEDVNALTTDDFIEVLFHEPEVNVTTPLLDKVDYNVPPLYTPDMNV